MIRLSHSAKDKMNFCGALYKNHYINRIRSLELGSALFFGSALDDAFGCLLLEKKKHLTDEEQLMLEKGAKTLFFEGMNTISHNSEDIDISTYPYATYFKSDYDSIFLSKEFDLLDKIKSRFPDYNDIKEFMDYALTKNVELSDEENLLKNYVCWLCLVEKGKLMIEQYKNQVIPEIEEVFDIQKKIELPNENGDVIVGYIDFIASFNDEPGVVYIVDNKTSSRAYKKDSVVNSEQLATYCHHENTNKGAYVVVEKTLRKRDPFVKISIIKDTIPEKQFDKTLDTYVDTLYNVKEGNFDKNYESKCFLFGRKCAYYDYCRSGGKNMEGLVQLSERSEK